MPDVKCHKCGGWYDCRTDEYMGLCYECEPRPFVPYLSKAELKDRRARGNDRGLRDNRNDRVKKSSRVKRIALIILLVWYCI